MYDFQPLKLVIDNDLESQIGAVNVDYNDSVWRSGFKITSAKPVAAGAGGCDSGKCC